MRGTTCPLIPNLWEYNFCKARAKLVKIRYRTSHKIGIRGQFFVPLFPAHLFFVYVKVRAPYQIGIFRSVSVSIFRYLLIPYRRQTRSVYRYYDKVRNMIKLEVKGPF
jgi:hypothetical protein